MVAGCGANIAKMTLFVFNFLVWLVGLALIVVGSLVLANDDYGAIFGTDTNTLKVVSGVVIGVGSFIFILAFAGCCGAMKESSCLLKMYIGILITLVILEIVGGILAFVYRGEIEKFLVDTMSEQVKTEYNPGDTDFALINDFYDKFQMENECCGSVNYTDYKDSKWRLTNTSMFVPTSCCQPPADAYCGDANTAKTDAAHLDLIYRNGCSATIVQFFEDNYLILGAIALGLIVFEILASIFACCVISGISNGEYE